MYHFNNYSSAAFSTLTLVCAHHLHPSTSLELFPSSWAKALSPSNPHHTPEDSRDLL